VPVKSCSPSQYYDHKGTFGLSKTKGTTMGIGNRFDKKSFIVPGSYDLPGPFMKQLPSTLLKSGAGTFGCRDPVEYDRQVVRGDKRADRSNPGPGAYYEYDSSPKARDFTKM
jgi:hypothetical protein